MSATGLSSAFAASSIEESLTLANCPNDYYGVYEISPTDYVAIETGETWQIVLEFNGNQCEATVNGGPGILNPDDNGSVTLVSCRISCESNGNLDLNIDGTQHNFSRNGTNLIVDGKAYPVYENQ